MSLIRIRRKRFGIVPRLYIGPKPPKAVRRAMRWWPW